MTYLDYDNVIPDSKTIKLLDTDEQLLKFHPAGASGNKKFIRVTVEYKKDFPYDKLTEDTNIPGNKSHTDIKVKVDKKMATQTLVYEPQFDADGNEIPFKPNKDNCDIIDDIDSKQTKNVIGTAANIVAFPLTVIFGAQEIMALSWDNVGDGIGSAVVATAIGVDMGVAGVAFASSVIPQVRGKFNVFDAKNAKKLGYISAGVDGAKGIGYAIKASQASTGAAQSRYAQRAAAYMLDGGLNAIAVAVPILGGALAVYSITTGLISMSGYGNPIAASLVGTPGAAISTIVMVFTGDGIPSAIIDNANSEAIEMFYENQKDLYCAGHEMVIALTPNEVISDGSCQTECGLDYNKDDCYEAPETSNNSGSSNDMCD